MLYGWTRDYVINLTFDEIGEFYLIGKNSDLRRRGFQFEETATQEEKEELYDLYYTEEEKKTLEKFKNKKGK